MEKERDKKSGVKDGLLPTLLMKIVGLGSQVAVLPSCLYGGTVLYIATLNTCYS